MARARAKPKPKTAEQETVNGVVAKMAMLRDVSTVCEKLLLHLENLSGMHLEDTVLRVAELLENEKIRSLEEVETIQKRYVT